MNVACFDPQIVLLVRWTRDAERLRLRLAAERAEMREDEFPNTPDTRNTALIDVMLAAMSCTESATANDIAARVVGLKVSTAQKYMRDSEKLGRVVCTGRATGEGGRGRKLWTRVRLFGGSQ